MEKADAQLRARDLTPPLKSLTPSPGTLTAMLRSTAIDCLAVSEYLDALPHAARVAELAVLPRALMRPWFEASFHFLPMRPTDLIPKDAAAWQPVEHVGVNNLWAARRFSKVMYRDQVGRVAGYNAQRWARATGPGYFTVQWHPFEALIDYTVLPERAPKGFPPIRDNARGLSFFVYRGLKDAVRRVSRDVCVGTAARFGKPLPNYFVLTRA